MKDAGASRANHRQADSGNKGLAPFRQIVGHRFCKAVIVLLGIVAGQFILYGPSLVGHRVLLPLDCLGTPRFYLPDTADHPNASPHDIVSQDIVTEFEPARRFAAGELAAGRFPLWFPGEYGGAPLVAPKYSPLFLLSCLTASPFVLAWVQLAMALVAGAGMHVFCRRVLRVGFWPSAIAAWCYPMTGFIIFWQGMWSGFPVYWLPWMLVAVHRTVRGGRAAPAGLAVATALVLVAGQLDVAALVLLVSGLFALWCLWQTYRAPMRRRLAGRAALALTLGWGLGFLLASPNLLPMIEYLKTGHRMAQRLEGRQERPPVGLIALPQVVFPDVYGSTVKGSFPLIQSQGESALPESAAAAYAGVLATLVAAPLAGCSRRHRSLNLFFIFLAVLGLSWCLKAPGVVQIMSLPGFNLLSYNRLVFATSFAILALAAVGLDVVVKRSFQWHRVFWLPAALLAALCAWCLQDAAVMPEQLPAQIEAFPNQGIIWVWIKTAEDVRLAQAWFALHYEVSALWCAAGVLLWLALHFRLLKRGLLMPVFGALLLGELWWFSHGRSVQADPALYYPEIPALRSIAEAAPGRVVGYNCLPANLAAAVGLRDVRGYDAVDPDRWISLLARAADSRSTVAAYAASQWLTPLMKSAPAEPPRLSPILDLLGVRYVIFRGVPPPEIKPRFQSPDYWVWENRSALPRVFIPKRVETVPDDRERLEKLSAEEFSPREVAYVETAVNLPSECAGDVTIQSEVPTRIVVAAEMKTAGLLVLADRWDGGWRASVNGRQVPILRTDHALRGVVLPPGLSRIEMQYRPTSLTLGLLLSAAAALVLVLIGGWWWWPFYRKERSAPATPHPE
jgi:hypothetical protein